MPSVKLYPSTISRVLAWTTQDNAKADDGAYAVTAGALNSNHDLRGSGFAHSIPAGSTINSIVAEVQYKLSTTASAWTGTLQAQKNGTLSGTAATTTAEPTTDTVLTNANTGAWTYADLANLQVLFRVRRTSSTGCNYSVDYIAVTVDYTEPTYNFSGSGSVTGTGSTTGAGNKQTSASGTVSGTGATSSLGYKGASGSGSVAGQGSTTGTGAAAEYTYDFSGTGAITGVGLCEADGIKETRAPPTALTGAGSTLGTGIKHASGSGSVTGTGSTTGAGSKQVSGTGATIGTANMTGTGVKGASDSGAITGVGSITATGNAAEATYDFSGSGAITGQGLCTADGIKQARAPTAGIISTGSIASSGSKQSSSIGIVTGASNVLASGTKQAIGQGSVSGTGAITAIGTADVPTYDYNGSGAIAGAGNIVGVGAKQAMGAGQVTGASNITASYVSARYGTGIIIGTGIITTAGTSRRLYRVDNPHRVQVTRSPSSKSVRTIETARVTTQLKSKLRVVVTLDK